MGATSNDPGGLKEGVSSMAFKPKSNIDILADCQPRPGYGTLGTPIKIEANLFRARFDPNKGRAQVRHYDVSIEPVVKVPNQRKPKHLMAAIWEELCATAAGQAGAALAAGAYDLDASFWTPLALVPDDEEFLATVTLANGNDTNDNTRKFRVVVRFANLVDLGAIQDYCTRTGQAAGKREMVISALHAMNVLLRQDPAQRFKPAGAQGRRFFGIEGAEPINNGAQVLKGFFQSFRPTQSGMPAVQLDTAYSAFVRPGRGDVVALSLLGGGPGGGVRGGRGGRGGMGHHADTGRGARGGGSSRGGYGPTHAGVAAQPLRDRDIEKLRRILKGAKFEVSHRPSSRTYTIQSITFRPARDLVVELQGSDGRPDRKMPLIQYFKETYKVHIENPLLPCVEYGKGKGKKANHIPLELIRILDFHSVPMISMSAQQTADMIKVAAKRPEERRKLILDWRATLNYSNLPKLKSWALQVRAEMMEVDARILAPPRVLYRGSSVNPSGGGWNLKGGVNKFLLPGKPLKSWGVLCLDRGVPLSNLQTFVRGLVSHLKANGVTVNLEQPPLLMGSHYSQRSPGEYDGVREGMEALGQKVKTQSGQHPQLLVVIEPAKDTALKNEIKTVGAQGIPAGKPVVTQVLLAKHLDPNNRGLDQYLNNVTMKINLKLGGANHTVDNGKSLDKTTLLMGADVTHPPSVPFRSGATAAPIPPSIAVSVAVMPPTNVQPQAEIRLQKGRTEMIEDFEDMVHSHIKLWTQKAGEKPRKILVYRDGVSEGQYKQCFDHEFAAIKAACARFGPSYKPDVTFIICGKRHHMRFFAKRDQDKDKTGNIKPGLVVDRDVTDPYAFDFYLQAHAGLQGTARPTHYVVIRDEIGYTADGLQTLTNNLCYTFARATRSVSLVPVAYYADLAAYVVRPLVYRDDFDAASEVSSSTGAASSASSLPRDYISAMLKDLSSVAWFL